MFKNLILILFLSISARASDPYLDGPLIRALKNEDVAEVNQLLSKGANPDLLWGDHETPLTFAIEKNNHALVKVILNHGANINLSYNVSSSETPLIKAIENDNLEIASLLLERGANPNTETLGQDLRVLTPLSFVESPAAARLLLSHGAHVNETSWAGIDPFSDGESALIEAARSFWDIQDAVEILKVLIDHGADPNQVTEAGGNALDYLLNNQNCHDQRMAQSVDLLLKAGSKISKKFDQGVVQSADALYLALSGGCTGLFWRLLKSGQPASLNDTYANSQDQSQKTLLDLAIMNLSSDYASYRRVVDFLMESPGVDLNSDDGVIGSPLDYLDYYYHGDHYLELRLLMMKMGAVCQRYCGGFQG